MENTKMLPVGIENFEEIRTENFYYIDKTGFIADLLNNWGKVNLFTRPRRFGKSLNMSMLKYFFEYGCNEGLFHGLKISKEKELCAKYMGKFPVISISLKGVGGSTFESAKSRLCSAIRREARRFQYLLESEKLSIYEKESYAQLIRDGNGDSLRMNSALEDAILNLSVLLQRHFAQKVIILIDEYDVPLDKAQQKGYYNQMVELIRSMFAQALKGNDSLYFAVLSGCLRVSKESIFTGLNNTKVFSVSDIALDEYFGFTEKEVKELLSYYDVSHRFEMVKDWYDGYQFGEIDVFCPWDVICYCDALRSSPDALPQDYWTNTSGNDIVRYFIQNADSDTTKDEIERLIAGETIRKTVRQELTYKELYDSIDHIWSVLYTTGYLTKAGMPDGKELPLRIPNLEIREIFTTQIYRWFQETAQKDGGVLNAFCEAFQNGDAVGIERQFNEYLEKTISIRDTAVRKWQKENFYHGILLGLLSYKTNWSVSSNKESGNGYSDILIKNAGNRMGIVIEVKYQDSGDMIAGCVDALAQIEKLRYADAFHNDGITTVLKYGIVCNRKQCKVLLGES